MLKFSIIHISLMGCWHCAKMAYNASFGSFKKKNAHQWKFSSKPPRHTWAQQEQLQITDKTANYN